MTCYTTDEWEELAKAAADKIGPTETERLRGALHTLSGKGWDRASIVLGFAFARGLAFDESLALANQTRYPVLGLPVNKRKLRT